MVIVSGAVNVISGLSSTDAIISVPPKGPVPNPRPTSPSSLPSTRPDGVMSSAVPDRDVKI